MLHTSAVAYLKEIFDGNKNTEGKLKGKPNNSKKNSQIDTKNFAHLLNI